MKQYEIVLNQDGSVYFNKKKDTLKYIEDNRKDVKGVYITKNNALEMFITTEDIKNKVEWYFL